MCVCVCVCVCVRVCVCVIFFIKAYIVGTHLNCIDVDAIQMGTHKICLYKEVDKNCTGCNLKAMEFLTVRL